MTTRDAVAKKKAEVSAEQLAAAELVRMAGQQGLSLTGPEGLLAPEMPNTLRRIRGRRA
jgi:hypothetical protein